MTLIGRFRVTTEDPKTISLELYDGRLPIYRIAIQFLRLVRRD